MTEDNILLLYVFSWFLIFGVYYYKTKQIGIAGFIFLFYGVSSITSLFFKDNDFVPVDNIQVLPLLYIIICVLISAYPFMKYGKQISNTVIDTPTPNSTFLSWLKLSAPIIIWAFVEFSIKAYNTNTIDLAGIYEDRDDQMRASFLGNACMTYVRFFDMIWPIIFLVCLSKWETCRRYSWIPLLGTLTMCISAYAGASRASILKQTMYFICVYYLMRNNVNVEIRKKVQTIGLISLSLIFLMIGAVTISRFDSGSQVYSLAEWISLYTGEGCLRFSQYVWDIDKISFGDTNFSFIKNLFGFDTFTDNDLRREYYASYLGIRTDIFYTYIGDLCIDLGKIPAAIFLCALSYMMTKLIKRTMIREKVSMIDGFLLAIYLTMILFGVMYCFFKTYNMQLRLLETLISLYILQKLLFQKS